jgi:hypothetical protein
MDKETGKGRERMSILQNVVDEYTKDYHPTEKQLDTVDELYTNNRELDVGKYYGDASMVIGGARGDIAAMETIAGVCARLCTKPEEDMTAAPQIAAGVHARWPDEQMVLSKADSGMSFATKMDVVRTCFNENDVQVVIDPKREV